MGGYILWRRGRADARRGLEGVPPMVSGGYNICTSYICSFVFCCHSCFVSVFRVVCCHFLFVFVSVRFFVVVAVHVLLPFVFFCSCFHSCFLWAFMFSVAGARFL